MNRLTKLQRFNQLHAALEYCTGTGGVFTTGERICINQERAALLHYDDEAEFIHGQAPAVSYNKELQDKIDKTLSITRHNTCINAII